MVGEKKEKSDSQSSKSSSAKPEEEEEQLLQKKAYDAGLLSPEDLLKLAAVAPNEDDDDHDGEQILDIDDADSEREQRLREKKNALRVSQNRRGRGDDDPSNSSRARNGGARGTKAATKSVTIREHDDDNDDYMEQGIGASSIRDRKIQLKNTLQDSSSSATSTTATTAPPLQDARIQPGAFRAGNNHRASATISYYEGSSEMMASESQAPPAVGTSLASSAGTAGHVVEATLVPETNETPDRAAEHEVFKAELMPSEEEIQRKNRRKRWLFGVVLIAVVVIAVVAIATVVSNDDNSSENVNTGGGDGDRNPPPPPPENNGSVRPEDPVKILSTYNRITHHVAVFRWRTPKNCMFKTGDDKHFDFRPYVRVECGDRSDNLEGFILVWGLDQTSPLMQRAICEYRGDIPSEATCTMADPAQFNTSLQDALAAYVVFSCGTNAADYPLAYEANRTAKVKLETLTASCSDDNGENDNAAEVFQVGLAVGRICDKGEQQQQQQSDSVLHLAEECGGKDNLPETYNVTVDDNDGVTCTLEKDNICVGATLAGNADCSFPFGSFSVSEDFNEPACQVEDVEGQKERLLDYFRQSAVDERLQQLLDERLR